METSFLTQWLSDHEIKAICWTLIHSLWIGLIIAALAGLVITFTRKSAADVRYRLLCGVLVLFILSVSITFYVESRSAVAGPANPDHVNVVISYNDAGIVHHTNPAAPISTANKALNFLNLHINVVFLVWLLFFVMKSLKMASGLLYIQRLRSYKVHEVAEEFKHKIELFSRQIGIGRTVRLVQSELVKVPVAVGWLKPVVLLPIGIILQLSTEQLESILWHELAHIRRRDYLVNILQGLVETVFFFNPGLLWLSSLIRDEREACCDDIVLGQMSQKANYLEALLSFGFEGNKQAGLAMGIGSGSQLRNRLKRMISQENKRLSIAEKAVLSFGLILLLVFTTIPKNSAFAKHIALGLKAAAGAAAKKNAQINLNSVAILLNVQHKAVQVNADTIRLKRDTIHFTSLRFKDSNADVTNCDIMAVDDHGNDYHLTMVDNKLAGLELNGVKVAGAQLPGYEYLMEYVQEQLVKIRRIDHGAMMHKADSLREAFYSKKYRKEPLTKFKGGNDAAMHTLDSIKAAVDRQQWAEEKSNRAEAEGIRNKIAAMGKRANEDSISYTGQLQRVQSVIADLIKDKVIADVPAVKWFGLCDTAFIVNGQRQPEDMRQRYAVKYGIHEGYGLYYGPVQMHGTGVFINAGIPGRGRGLRMIRPKRLAPGYMGAIAPRFVDTTAWKSRELIAQQQHAVAVQDFDRNQLMRQQIFVAKQAEKRIQFDKEQHVFAAAQDEKHKQIMVQQRIFLTEQAAKQRNVDNEQFKNNRQRFMAQRDDLWSADKGLAKQQRFNRPRIALEPIISDVVNDLVSENIVKDKNDLTSFNLTNTFMVVNDIRQSDEVHEKFKEKYLIQPKYASLNQEIVTDPNFGLHYDAPNHGMGIGINNYNLPAIKAVR